VQATNAKLVERRENMLFHLTGKSSGDVREALRRTHGNVKLAVLLLKGCELDEAERLLVRAGGQLRAALALFSQGRSNITGEAGDQDTARVHGMQIEQL
jgi:N-acetylmuramic acid 6-phosphate etherase